MPEALPAVTVPPSRLNAGGSLARPSTLTSARTCSSRVKACVSFLTRTSTGTIWSSKRPSSWAAAARRCDSTANWSWRSREMPWRSETFSAVMPMWTEWNGSVSPPTTGSTTSVSPIRAPQRAAGIQ